MKKSQKHRKINILLYGDIQSEKSKELTMHKLSCVVPVTRMAGELGNLESWVRESIKFDLEIIIVHDIQDFQTGIDWAFIIFIATCSGIGATLNYLGLNDIIAKNLVNLLGTNFKDPFYFISLIIISTLLIRMFLPITPSVLILCTIFIPISNFYNISPWLASIVILVTADMWFLPYQNFFYVMFEEFSNSNYNQKKFILFNIIMNIVRVGGIYLSMPYWSKLGLM